jgi:hypothetical protein
MLTKLLQLQLLQPKLCQSTVSQIGIVKLYNAKSALLLRCIFREYYEVVADSDIVETLINFGDKPKDMQDKIGDLPVLGVFFKTLTELSPSQSLEMIMMSSLHGT